jgi:hypothetical protein
MACPYFEPQQAVLPATRRHARLPLIDEFDGVCRALPEPLPVPAEGRLRLCNHGNVLGQCEHFPAQEQRSAFRFEVVRRSAAHLDLLLIEEALYAPLTWHRLKYSIDSEQLQPDPPDPCRHAQLLAFCRSYLRQYPG